MTAAVAVHNPLPTTWRVVAGAVALIQGALAVSLPVFSLGVSGRPEVAPVFVVFFGLGALAAAVHAFPTLAARWPILKVRPGTVKAGLAFFAAALHWMVAAGSAVGIFIADTLWVSVPMFFGTLLSLAAISALFAASGYFLYTLERVPNGELRN